MCSFALSLQMNSIAEALSPRPDIHDSSRDSRTDLGQKRLHGQDYTDNKVSLKKQTNKQNCHLQIVVIVFILTGGNWQK